ncbi:amidohydrolase family protein [Epidermidibacterium keratini]|uniref:Amidohydrolase family protein n=1 Tax=Epidermidibacterium keratini TaxID=1891644 RepID=A0A7L4YW31_9ACTN|nr:amidohydrolase family protein [Epidermidibacterium keratini]
MVLRRVRPWGGGESDIIIDGGSISNVVDHDPDASYPEAEVVEGESWVALPTFADVHVHLDSTRWGLPFKPHTAGPSLIEHIEADRAGWREDLPIAQKATRMLGRLIECGATKIRSYAQIDSYAQLERLDGVLAAKEKYAEQADVTIMAFPQSGIMIDPGTADLLDAALARGVVDVVGGIDPCGLDRDPKGHLDVVFGLAQKYQKPVDLHIHESGELGAFSWELVFERTRALGMQGQVTISHGMALGTNDAAVEAALIEQLADLDVAMATVAPRRSVQLPFRRLMDSGVRVGLGQDGMRDYWSPYGNGDMLDRLYQLCLQQNIKYEDDFRKAAYVATLGGRQVIDPDASRPAHDELMPGITPGDDADLILLEAEGLTTAIIDRPGLDKRRIIRRGALV